MSDAIDSSVDQLIVQVAGTAEVLDEVDLDLFEAGVLDSMGFVELLFAFETEFGFSVPPTEIERDEVSTVGRIRAFVRERA